MSSVAAAQPVPAPKDAVEAKRHFEVGLRLYNEHATVQALVEFRQSYATGGRASALRNIAQCERDLQQFSEAFETYTLLRVKHEKELSAPDLFAVDRALNELAVLTATVLVTPSESDAEIFVDGQTHGSTMTSPARTNLGAHRIRVFKEGFDAFEQSITLTSKQELVLAAPLKRQTVTGHVSVVEVHGRSVRVIIDGQDRGAAPYETDLAAGEHTVEAVGNRFAAEKTTVVVTARQSLRVPIDATATMGRIHVTANPPQASIWVDGRKAGVGEAMIDVVPGDHDVVATTKSSVDGANDETRAHRLVRIDRGETFPLSLVLGVASKLYVPIYRGMYSRIAFSPTVSSASYSGSFSGAAADSLAGVFSPTINVGGTETGTFSASYAGLGAAADLYFGYNFDYLGIEFVTGFQINGIWRRVPTSPEGALAVESLGPGSGPFTIWSIPLMVGGRLTSHGLRTRLTLGLDGGLNITWFSIQTSSRGLGVSGNDVSVPSVVPGIKADVGLLFGRTPGTKFYIGIGGTLLVPVDASFSQGLYVKGQYQFQTVAILGACVVGVQVGH